MKLRFCCLTFLFIVASLARAQTSAQSMPSWKDEIARGYMPYAQLKVEDLPINDQTDPKTAFQLQSFIHPRWHLLIKPGDGIVDVMVDQWLIFSGFDRNQTWRKSSFKEMKSALPYAQAILDLNEIYARQLGAVKLDDLPQFRNTNAADAFAEMEAKVKELADAKRKQAQVEQEALAKATDNGHDAKKVREKAAEIRKRLDATTPATVPYPHPPRTSQ